MKNFLFFLIFLIFSNNAAANTLVAWETNTDADYYVVYWGDAPGDYTSNSSNIPSGVNEFEIPNIENKELYIAVKAFNDCGNSSEFSEEVQYICGAVGVTTGVTVSAKKGININIEISAGE